MVIETFKHLFTSSNDKCGSDNFIHMNQPFFNSFNGILNLSVIGNFTYQNPELVLASYISLGQRLRVANDEDFVIVVDNKEIKVSLYFWSKIQGIQLFLPIHFCL